MVLNDGNFIETQASVNTTAMAVLFVPLDHRGLQCTTLELGNEFLLCDSEGIAPPVVFLQRSIVLAEEVLLACTQAGGSAPLSQNNKR